jgi:hypothetical protein
VRKLFGCSSAPEFASLGLRFPFPLSRDVAFAKDPLSPSAFFFLRSYFWILNSLHSLVAAVSDLRSTKVVWLLDAAVSKLHTTLCRFDLATNRYRNSKDSRFIAVQRVCCCSSRKTRLVVPSCVRTFAWQTQDTNKRDC